MNLSTRYLRRLINKFTKEANYETVFGGGLMLYFDNCDFRLKEYAIWSARTYMIEYTFYGKDWILRLLDSPNEGKRLLQIVGQSGNIEAIEPSIRGFVL